MRILGEIPHPYLKITLMHHGRYLLKLEDVDAEITYRYREGAGVSTVAEARKVLQQGLLKAAEQTLKQMRTDLRTYAPKQDNNDNDFPTLI